MNDDYQNAIRLLPLIGRHRADDTSDWRTICIALKNCGVPYEVFEEWSLTPKYQDKYQIIPLDDDYSPEQGKSSEKTSQKILRMIMDDANITIKQMAENLSLSTRAIEKQIAKLREKNLLSRDGADNGGSWVILSSDKK
ncbi:MAG: winged helix-turn-helix transcriptional regulator [Lentisphaerae bacterium]|nr:winged helix-turn-helix transcriptional regulator [Lentisphaerota bacterium]